MDRKEAARALRTNPLLPEILDALETGVVEAWKAAQTLNARETAHADIRAVNNLREQIDVHTRIGGDATTEPSAGDGVD